VPYGYGVTFAVEQFLAAMPGWTLVPLTEWQCALSERTEAQMEASDAIEAAAIMRKAARERQAEIARLRAALTAVSRALRSAPTTPAPGGAMTPATEAGKDLLAAPFHHLACDTRVGHDCDCALPLRVRRIEAEAVAARNAEIAEAVRGLPDQGDHEFGWKAAVLAIVERP
jgi:hypothetical protein